MQFSLPLGCAVDLLVFCRDGISSTPLEIKKSGELSNLMLTGRDTENEKRFVFPFSPFVV